MIKEGIYQSHELSNEAYHADLAIGSSGLKVFAECPAIYEHFYVKGNKKNGSKFSLLGQYAHVALLEPEIFKQHYLVAPENAVVNKGRKDEKTTTMNKAHGDWKSFCEEAEVAGKIPMLYTEYQQAQDMAEALDKNSLARALLTGGKAEMSFFAVDEATGLRIKSRPDYLVNVPGIGVVLPDYKTTALSLDAQKQGDHAFSLGRYIQGAHHKITTEVATGGKIEAIVYVTQMQEAPYLVRTFRLKEKSLAWGEARRRELLDGIAECHKQGVFPGYAEIIEDLPEPRWMEYATN